MKNRLTALDGLRGFAALSVVLSHLDVKQILQVFGPFFTAIFRIFAAGPYGVQILFVLTGFLMAYLYPVITHPRRFIQKRYTRIFPTFATTVVFFWLITLPFFNRSLILQIALFILVTVGGRMLWQKLKSPDESGRIGTTLFLLFLGFQILVAATHLFLIPRMHISQTSSVLLSVDTFLTNLTLTTPLTTYITRLNTVYWSLTPEVLFYIAFPFIVIPTITVAKKWGLLISLTIIVAATKVLFDLDHEASMQSGLLAINIARASGFIAGVTAGSIYREKGALWKNAARFLKNPLVNLVMLSIFIIILWKDAAFRDGGDPVAYNYFYLFNSWVSALIIFILLIPHTLFYKIFSSRVLLFLGTISYTLYLTHIQAIAWATSLLLPLNRPLLSGVHMVLLIALSMSWAILLAWLLYRLVDSLYFTYRKTLPQVKSGEKISHSLDKPSMYQALPVITLYILIIIAVYSARYPLSFAVYRHHLAPIHTNLDKPQRFPFTAAQDNLSIIAMALHYRISGSDKTEKSAEKIRFRLFNSDNKLIFESYNSPRLVNGTPEFEFGFPQINNSQHKSYIAELAIIHANHTDSIEINTAASNFITYYRLHKNILLPMQLFWNRISFTLGTPPASFALFLAAYVLFLSHNASHLFIQLVFGRAKKVQKVPTLALVDAD